MTIAIKIDNVSKLYRLGTVGTGTISHDLNRWWHTIRGKEDPYAKVGQLNDRTQKATQGAGEGPSLASKFATSPDYVWALKDINLEVERGEILGIIGRNGAGKSTLLKLLSRVTAPSTGSIKANGRIASLLEVGTGFHPELTGRENIYLNGAILGMKRHETSQRLDEIVDFSGCDKYLDTPVKRYSSGMMVRLGFAVAAHLECEILVVDEVLAVGDAEFQRKCIGKMQQISKGGGRTVIFVSHNMPSVEQLCSRAVLVDSGGVHSEGHVPDVVTEYLSSNRQLEGQDLSTRAAAMPEKQVALTRISCIGAEQEGPGPISISEDWLVTLELDVRRPVLRPDLAIAIESENGTRISRVRSSETAQVIPNLSSGTTSVRCHLKDLNLSPGHYTLLIGVAESGGALLEYVENALQVEVVSRGNRGLAIQSDQSRSLCFFQCDWSVSETS